MAIEDLSRIPLLHGVSPERLKLLENRLVPFQPGEPVITKDDPPKHIVLIRSGEVAVQVNGVHLVTRKRDEILGEQAFINGEPHSADCIAVTPVQATCLPADVAHDFLGDPAFVQNLLAALSKKLRESSGERQTRYATQERLFAEFRSHVSAEVLTDLLNRGVSYGSPRLVEDVAVLFSDIRGFTRYVHDSGADAASLVAQELSDYLSDVTDLIHRNHGFVDKFIGDAVMAFWGYPGIERRHNDKILHCAEDMIALGRRHKFGRTPGDVGVGINQGTCFMGNIGNAGKRQFTVIGDAVNVASRFESLTKDHGSIVVGKDFLDGLSESQKQRFEPHTNIVRGAGAQTFYSIKNEV
jgi:class 3 adenylate cyclase